MRKPCTKILRTLPSIPLNTNNNQSELFGSEENVEKISVVETMDDSPAHSFIIPPELHTTSQYADPSPQQSKASCVETTQQATKLSSSTPNNSTRHHSTSRRRPIISQNKNDQFLEAKIKALSSANEYAAEQHKLVMEIYKEKLKQEQLATEIIAEKLKMLKRKNSVELLSDEGS